MSKPTVAELSQMTIKERKIQTMKQAKQAFEMKIKIPRCLHFTSGFCFYDGFLKANTTAIGETDCNGCFKCEVYQFEHNIKPCGVCEEGYLIPKVDTDGTHYSVCTYCLSETSDAEQAKKNKEIYKDV